jgi:peroxiredoxin
MNMRFIPTQFARAAAAVLALSVAAMAPAAAEPELGPKVGTHIPHELSGRDSKGAARDFKSLIGPNGMALYFIRSVDWCPYCRAQTLSVDAARSEFAKRGVNVVFVSYDSTEKQTDFIRQNDISVTLLSDPKSEIIDAFKLRNETYKEGRFAGIPYPAVFYVKPDGVIAAKLYETDYLTNDKSYRQRPEVAAILQEIDKRR